MNVRQVLSMKLGRVVGGRRVAESIYVFVRFEEPNRIQEDYRDEARRCDHMEAVACDEKSVSAVG